MIENPPGTKPRPLMVVNVLNPDRGGGGAIFSDLAYGLAERGFDVTVRCAYPCYPEWEDRAARTDSAYSAATKKASMAVKGREP